VRLDAPTAPFRANHVSIRIALLTVLLLGSAAAAAAPDGSELPLIDRSVFFGNPERARVRISPDGRHLAYVAPHKGVLNVWVHRLDHDDARPITDSTDQPIRNYRWARNAEQILYLQDRDGDENDHVYAVDLSTGRTTDLTPHDGVKAYIVAADRNHPDEILVGMNKRTAQLFDVWKINTRTGDSSMVFENDGAYINFVADSNLDVRVVGRFRRDGGTEAFIRDSADAGWYELARWDPQDAATSSVLRFDRSGDTLYVVDSRRADTGRLHAYTVDESGTRSYEQLAAHPRADLDDVLFDPKTGRPQAVSFEYDRVQWKVLDDSIADDWSYLQQITDGDLQVTSRSNDDRLWTVAYVDDDGPVRYYLYDRDAVEAEFLFTNRPELENLPLAEMEPVIIRARDGLELVSYLTLPPDVSMSTAENLPMVLLVHGGPWARDSWGYNPMHQWLANRGYAVLSVNFRVSTGFGKAFVNAGDREWARGMHNDLIDATLWAVDKEITDPKRVAIMGGSYGGYATLVGLTFTPEFFAAGVDIVGPSHVRTLLESIPPHWEPVKAMFNARVGRLDEQAYLDSISPLTRVDEITRPLLIGQGRNDPRVKESESRQIVEAMQKKNLPVTYVLFPDEGHGFARPVNNMAFFAITEAFLHEHLGGRMQPIGSAVRQSSAMIEAGAELIPGLAAGHN